jgi:DNA-binding beta-propeller fold protein YncE
MPPQIGSGRFTYETEEGWTKLPEGHDFPDASGVTVDSQDNVYILNRGAHPVIVVDKNGNFLRAWGEGEFDARAHGIHCSPDDYIWTVNDNQHCIKKYTPEGKLVLTIGVEGQAAEKWSGNPFNRPTNMAISPNTGDVYITDGYGNARVHRYTSEGKHIVSWGAPGVAKGEFQVPHNVVIDNDENVYVTDRENHRLQVFDSMGNLKDIWYEIYRPQALCIDREEGVVYIGEMLEVPDMADYPKLGHRLNAFSLKGERLARIGDPMIGDGPTQFIAPHGFGVDSQGNLYVGEVSYTVYGRRMNPPQTFRCFRKLKKVG